MVSLDRLVIWAITAKLVTQVQQELPAYKFGTSNDDLSDRHPGVQVHVCCCQCSRKRAQQQTQKTLKRFISAWNSMPANVDFSSLPRFKQSVEQSIFHNFCSVMTTLCDFDYSIYFTTLCVFLCVFFFP